MHSSRRDFLKTSAAVGGALGLGVPVTAQALSATGLTEVQPLAPVTPAAAPLKILILGGTGFIGPAMVRYAVARGHTVTLFNRGRTNPGLFPNVEQLTGDRATGDYASLKGRQWDVVIDNPTTLPRWAREAAAALKGNVQQYVFISTISVYARNDTPGADETAALATTTEPDNEDRTAMNRNYGAFKALSEGIVQQAFPGRATIIRPGLIVGPGDVSDRFTYWPVRLRRGGEVLAPGKPTDPTQYIDARDLAEYAVRCVENKTYGVFNVTGPGSPITMAEMLGGIRAVLTSDIKLTWVDAAFLTAQQPPVRAWSDMPVWINPVGGSAGFMERSIKRALDTGLTFRPFADTVRATLEFYDQQPEERKAQLRAGLPAEREAAVLAAWHAREGAK
jgi:2'-hydroxyisoflavone reductase